MSTEAMKARADARLSKIIDPHREKYMRAGDCLVLECLSKKDGSVGDVLRSLAFTVVSGDVLIKAMDEEIEVLRDEVAALQKQLIPAGMGK